MFRRKTEPTEPENSTDREIYYPEITVLLEDLMRGSFVSFPILEEVNVVQIRELENAARELAQSYESQAIAETDAYRKHAARAAARYYDVVARIASEVAKYKTLIVKSRGKVLRDDIVPLGLITYAELPYTKLKAIEGSPYLEWPRSRYLEETGHMCADTANCENRLALLKVELAKFPGRQVNEYLTALALPLDSWLRPLDKGSDSFASVEQSQTSNSP